MAWAAWLRPPTTRPAASGKSRREQLRVCARPSPRLRRAVYRCGIAVRPDVFCAVDRYVGQDPPRSISSSANPGGGSSACPAASVVNHWLSTTALLAAAYGEEGCVYGACPNVPGGGTRIRGELPTCGLRRQGHLATPATWRRAPVLGHDTAVALAKAGSGGTRPFPGLSPDGAHSPWASRHPGGLGLDGRTLSLLARQPRGSDNGNLATVASPPPIRSGRRRGSRTGLRVRKFKRPITWKYKDLDTARPRGHLCPLPDGCIATARSLRAGRAASDGSFA